MERTDWSRRPYTRGDYKQYVIGTAKAAGVAGFLIGCGIGIFVYLGLSMYGFKQYEAILGMLAVGLFTGGCAMLFTLYRESAKWDEHDTVESEKSPAAPIIQVDGEPKPQQKSVKLGLWVRDENGSEQMVQRFNVLPEDRLKVQSWLLAMAAQTEKNVTRDHAWNYWGVEREVYDAWRTIVESGNGIIKGEARNSPVILNEVGRGICAFMGASVGK